MAGHMISLYMKEHGHYIVGFDKQEVTHCESITGNAKDLSLLEEIVRQTQYDSIINCIGVLNEYAEQNKELAVFLNSYLPHFLACVTKDSSTQIIHMSTDCVFSGKSGGYTEDSLRDGESFYDRTKALGELEDSKNITLRCSIVGPDMNESGIGLFNWFMKQTGKIRGYTKAIWTGVTTLELAKAMEYAAQKKASGLYNLVYTESISKYNLLQLFNNLARADKIDIEPHGGIVIDKSLKRTRFEFDYVVPDYETMISEMVAWIANHKYLYSHYEI
jgi:dTDP-4-dehydrorhamnose reductase